MITRKGIHKAFLKFKNASMNISAGAWNAASRVKPTVRWLMSLPGDADENNQYDIVELRQKSGDLVRNFPIARSVIDRKKISIVGSGIRLKPMVNSDILKISEEEAVKINDEIQSNFRMWAEPLGVCDIERQVNFTGYQRLLLESRLERGDVFTVFVNKKRPGCSFDLRLQMIEADQVSNPNNQPDTESIKDGIERDVDGEAVALHYQVAHPGNTTNAGKRTWLRVPFFDPDGRRRVLHFFDKKRRGQSRGVPDLAPAIEALAQVTEFQKAYLHKALINAFLAVTYKGDDMNNPLDGLGGATETTQSKLSPFNAGLRKLGIGTAVELGPEESLEAIESKTPNDSFGPFYEAILQSIASSVNVPPEILMMLFSTSYTAAQAAFQEFWRYVETERDAVYTQLREIYKVWFDSCVENGVMDFPDYKNGDALVKYAYTQCMLVAPSKGHLRPNDQNKADALSEDRGWKTAEQNAQERGNDYKKPSLLGEKNENNG
jgi:lambda family phage portal protein